MSIFSPVSFACVLICASATLAGEPAGPITFQDISATSGITFRYQNGTRGRHDLPEIMGGGVAMIDFDGDGRLDLYFCNGGPIDKNGKMTSGELYRNKGDWTFARVTEAPPGPPYAMGTAVGDFDNDGRDDLFISGWRGQRLYHNEGAGKFKDVTMRAGLESTAWTTSAAFADLDGDGDLDLYVAAYVDFDPAIAPFIAAPDGKRDYAAPEDFMPQSHKLYRNNNDGTFTDVSISSGIVNTKSRGLGVLIANLAGDSQPDIFVANDGTACSLFKNLGGMKFEDVGLASGVAFDRSGNALAAMGVTFGLIQQKPTLVVTNFYERSTIAFGLQASGQYDDVSGELGLAAATRHTTGFGIALADFDDDGHPDLIQANGHVLDRERLGVPFAMRPTLLRNTGSRFVDISARACSAFDRPILGRGLAVGDLDNDGRVDAVIAPIDAPPIVLRNTSPGCGLTLQLGGRAVVRVFDGGRETTLAQTSGGSYLSSSDQRPHVSFAGKAKVDRVEIRWPSGAVKTVENVGPGLLTTVEHIKR